MRYFKINTVIQSFSYIALLVFSLTASAITDNRNNFVTTSSFENGAQYCQQHNKGRPTCFPISNIGNKALTLHITTTTSNNILHRYEIQVNVGEISALYLNYSDNLAAATVIINESATSYKELYFGPITNNVGFKCTSTSCADWK